jgi:hypothetical protein
MITLTHLSGTRYFAAIGDSKTGGYFAPLINYLSGATGVRWEVALNHSTAGWTVANAQAGLAAALAGVSVNVEYVFVGLGTNDANDDPLPNEATWKAQYGDILDQCHAKWTTAQILVCKIWRGDNGGAYLTNCETLNSRIDDVLSTRGWASVAHNEFDWLPSWTADNVHPSTPMNAAAEQARQWYEAIAF